MIADINPSHSISPLELFLRDYLESVGGAWDEVEPQVYDLMLPRQTSSIDVAESDPTFLRVTFDPEALADHPQAQLASLGTPLLDQMLLDSIERARLIELHLVGLNLQPHQLPARVARTLSLDESLRLEIRSVRPLDFPQIVFWFEATFTADQREQEIVPLAIDLHYGRQVRHLDELLDRRRLTESPPVLLPEAAGITRAAAYFAAREQAVRTVSSLANTRARELSERLEKQVARMNRYYDDLLQELNEQSARSASRGGEPDAKFQSRRQTLASERELRIAELRRKNSLTARMRLLNALVVHQPKLEVQSAVVEAGPIRAGARPFPPHPLSLVWDPLMESLEPLRCPTCGRPTFELIRRQSGLICGNCRA